MAPIDVATGQWDAFSPKPIQDTSASARYTRAASDQQQVAVLKARAYAKLAQDIAKNMLNSLKATQNAQSQCTGNAS